MALPLFVLAYLFFYGPGSPPWTLYPSCLHGVVVQFSGSASIGIGLGPCCTMVLH
jgi:hypothetical protein